MSVGLETDSFDSFDDWLDGFFGSYYRRRPVNATFIGIHEYDDQLPDLSAAGIDRSLSEIETLQSALEQFPTDAVNERERLDRKLAAGALEIQQWEFESGHFHRSNPCLYTGEAIFGVVSLFLTDFAPLEERVRDATARMEKVPAFLQQGQDALTSVPEHWVWRARDEVTAARALFGDGIETLAAQKGIESQPFRAAAADTLDAFEEFDEFLEDVPTTDDHSAGTEGLELVLRRGHFRAESLDDIVAMGERHLQAANEALEDGLDAFPEETVANALDALADTHPDANNYYDRHRELWERCRRLSDGEFVDWPDYPLEFVPRPEWVREAAQDLYFLFYRAPAPHDDIAPVECLLEPVEPDMDEETQRNRLRRWNTAQIKLNHVAHHGGLGHHVQNYHAYETADSRIGEMAAVDTASRIALCCGGTMAEGWSPYATDLLADTEFLTDREAYSLHATRRRMAARAVVDVKLHRGDFSADEAIAYYRDRANMGEWGARYEVVKNSMFPGMALMYLLGTQTVHDLRSDFEKTMGDDFDQREFHEMFLSRGSIPVALRAAQMREKHVD